MTKIHRVILTESQRASLGRQIAAGSSPARDLIHARILLVFPHLRMTAFW
jgi:hypothetical protein